MEQGKLVYVTSGKVYDVVVDIRRGSPWFSRYVNVVIEPGDMRYGYYQSLHTVFKH